LRERHPEINHSAWVRDCIRKALRNLKRRV
jgi:hypothetical protein